LGWHTLPVVQYTFTHVQYIEKHSQHKQYIEQHNSLIILIFQNTRRSVCLSCVSLKWKRLSPQLIKNFQNHKWFTKRTWPFSVAQNYRLSECIQTLYRVSEEFRCSCRAEGKSHYCESQELQGVGKAPSSDTYATWTAKAHMFRTSPPFMHSCIRASYTLGIGHTGWVNDKVRLTHCGRRGSFKLFKRPFPGFLTILTL